jgi:acetylornithine/succinyldiaminopimelate/putrescine aminotransferase
MPTAIAEQIDLTSTNAELQQLRNTAVPRGVATMLPVFAEHAANAEIWDVEGRRYIDFASGIAVVNTGHLHPRVKAAAAAQLDKLSHSCFQITPYEGYVRLADRLNGLVPARGPNKTIFLTTGAEAVENAVKIAHAYTKRPGAIAFSGGFHGRTMMGMALTGKVAPYKTGFGPFPGEVFHAPFPASYLGVDTEQSLKALETLFKADVEPERVAAIIVEPVQGEGGFYIAPAPFLQALRRICDDHGIVLIIDEIQTGFARTGRLFALEHAGIEADIVTMAKSLAGGFPLSAVTGNADIMDAALPGGLWRHLCWLADRNRGRRCGARRDQGRGSLHPRGGDRQADIRPAGTDGGGRSARPCHRRYPQAWRHGGAGVDRGWRCGKARSRSYEGSCPSGRRWRPHCPGLRHTRQCDPLSCPVDREYRADRRGTGYIGGLLSPLTDGRLIAHSSSKITGGFNRPMASSRNSL